MDIKKRIIPRLEIKSGNLVKGIRMEGLRVVNKNPELHVKKYAQMGFKEIFVEDIVASLYSRSIDFEKIKLISSYINIPLSYAGGIQNIQDIHKHRSTETATCCYPHSNRSLICQNVASNMLIDL